MEASAKTYAEKMLAQHPQQMEIMVAAEMSAPDISEDIDLGGFHCPGRTDMEIAAVHRLKKITVLVQMMASQINKDFLKMMPVIMVIVAVAVTQDKIAPLLQIVFEICALIGM